MQKIADAAAQENESENHNENIGSMFHSPDEQTDQQS